MNTNTTNISFLVLSPRPAVDGNPLISRIAPESGIVALALDSPADTWQIDFEGNLYGSASLLTLEARILHAADRGARLYPTVARFHLSRADMLRMFRVVGTLNYTALKELLKDSTRDPSLTTSACVSRCLDRHDAADETIFSRPTF